VLITLEANYMAPNATFWVLLVFVPMLGVVLVLWPLVESLTLRQ
jgi:uncharacterized BrkB/YihY/UPF0761 family membrane protein